MTSSINLHTAPDGYVPQVTTVHDSKENAIRQTFKGGRVVFVLSKSNSHGEAFVDKCLVGSWNDITVGEWSNILYTLSIEFKDIIK